MSFIHGNLLNPGCAVQRAGQLFREATHISLEDCERASDDPRHAAFLAKRKLGISYSVTELLDLYKIISHQEVRRNPSWMFAPVLVPTNAEKYTIIGLQSLNYAVRYGQYVVRFPKVYSHWKNQPHESVKDLVMQENHCFWDYFVAGADAILTINENKAIGITNGVSVTLHSLSLSPEQQFQVSCEINTKPKGSVITLKTIPQAICVALSDHEKSGLSAKLIQAGFLELDGHVIYPVFPVKASKNSDAAHSCSVAPLSSGNVYTEVGSVDVNSCFPVESTFGMTVHKTQGNTLDRIIIALSHRGVAHCDFTYEHLYVALSRARKANDIRILLFEEKSIEIDLHYLNHLKADIHVLAMLAGYGIDRPLSERVVFQKFNDQAALRKYDELTKCEN